MCTSKRQLDAWPESNEELLALIESFEKLQKQHAGEYSLGLSVIGLLTTQAEIDAVLKANDRLAAAAVLLYRKLDSWS